MFTHRWYPSLDSSQLGIGATGDYWLSGLSARDGAYGTLATIHPEDSALPDPAVTDQRFGPRLVTQPLPGTNSGLSWAVGARPVAKRTMTLVLNDVSGLTIDDTAARLPTGTITVTSDGPSRLGIINLPRGTGV